MSSEHIDIDNKSADSNINISKVSGKNSVDIPEPPDGGWGWVVVLGSFMVHVICDGIAYSFGVFVDTFVDHFGASYSEVGWMGSIMLGVTWGTGPIISILANKFGCRSVCAAGAVVAFVGMIFCLFAPNIYFMYFSFGLVTGFGLGMMYLPAIVSVSYYFEKRRSLAIGLAVCGSGVGTFVFAPITQMLLVEYGWKGTVLMEAAILLHGLLCGAVFRPLFIDIASSGVKKRLGKVMIVDNGILPEPRSDISVNRVNCQLSKTGVDDAILIVLSRRPSASSCRDDCRRQSIISFLRQRQRMNSLNYGVCRRPSVILEPLARQDVFYTGSLQNFPEYRTNPKNYRRQSVVRSVRPNDKDELVEEREENGSSMTTICRELCDCRLMFDPIFIMFALSNLMTSIGLCVPYVFLPHRGQQMGATPSNAAFLISIVGISNTVARIVFGFISDMKCVNRLMLYNTVLVLCGLLSMLSTFCVNYVLLATYAASFGSLIGMFGINVRC